MMLTDGLRSSDRDDWGTPQALYDMLDAEFGFTRDVCASRANAKHPQYWTVEDNALARTWEGTLWMNPPYGRTIGDWIDKAAEAARGGATVVALLPARSDTRWWGTVMREASELRFIRGRLKFDGWPTAAPFPSVIAIFGTPRVPVVRMMEVSR